MHKLYDLKEKLIQELEDYSENGKFSKEDVESIKYMASAVDHLANICEDGEYSGAYNYYVEGDSSNRGRSMRGNSYRRARRDSMGRYSRDNEEMVEQLRAMMEEAPEARQDIQRLITKIEKM